MIAHPIQDVTVEVKDGWLISVHHKPWTDGVDVYIAQIMKNKPGIMAYYFDKDGHMNGEEVKEFDPDRKPTMTMPRWVWDGFAQAISGVKETPDKQAVDSELKATKYHLEDVRKLVKGLL